MVVLSERVWRTMRSHSTHEEAAQRVFSGQIFRPEQGAEVTARELELNGYILDVPIALSPIRECLYCINPQ